MDHFAKLVIENLGKVSPNRYPLYEQLIEHAFTVAPPPYSCEWFGRRYFELSRDTEWFANSLVANSALEGFGSTQIWAFSNRMHGDIDVDAVATTAGAIATRRDSTTMLSRLPPGPAAWPVV